MEEPGTVVLDVRSPMEMMQGFVPGAKNIDIMSPDAANQFAALSKDLTYLVYCRSGNRSMQACAAMAQMGFEKLYNLQGGMMYWSGPLAN